MCQQKFSFKIFKSKAPKFLSNIPIFGFYLDNTNKQSCSTVCSVIDWGFILGNVYVNHCLSQYPPKSDYYGVCSATA